MNQRNPRGTTQQNPRKERVPLGTMRAKLSFKPREGYHGLVVNDYPEGHLQEALEAGYEFVKGDVKIGDYGQLRGTELGSMRSTVVGTKPDGSPMRGYFMEIKQEWHNEDMAEQTKRAQDIDDQIRGGTVGREGNEYGNDNQYVPEDGIKYDT